MRYTIFLFFIFITNIVDAQNLPDVSVKSKEFKKYLLESNYKDLTFYLDDYLSSRAIDQDGEHYLTSIAETLFSKQASDLELKALNKWIQLDDTSAWARILRSFFYLNQLKRFPAKVFTQQSKDKFIKDLIEQAAEDAEMSVRLARDNICARYAHLKVARYQNYKHEYQKRFNVLIKLYPQYFQAYLERMYELSPKWGGTPRDLINFAKQTASAFDDKSVLKCLPLYAHKLMAEHSKNPKKYLSRKNVLDDIQDAERIVSQAFPKSSKYLRLYSELTMKAGLSDLSQRALRQAEDREQSSSYFQD